jgi:hypothetical protein
VFREEDVEGKKALAAAIAVEMAARAAGFFDARIIGGRKNMRTWKPLASTKTLNSTDGAPPSVRDVRDGPASVRDVDRPPPSRDVDRAPSSERAPISTRGAVKR